MFDSVDPLDGWLLKDVLEKASPAKNDVYGSLYIYVHALLLEFCKEIILMGFSVNMFHVDAQELPGMLGLCSQLFDRLDVSLSSIACCIPCVKIP
jgi:hypothetical protein